MTQPLDEPRLIVVVVVVRVRARVRGISAYTYDTVRKSQDRDVVANCHMSHVTCHTSRRSTTARALPFPPAPALACLRVMATPSLYRCRVAESDGFCTRPIAEICRDLSRNSGVRASGEGIRMDRRGDTERCTGLQVSAEKDPPSPALYRNPQPTARNPPPGYFDSHT